MKDKKLKTTTPDSFYVGKGKGGLVGRLVLAEIPHTSVHGRTPKVFKKFVLLKKIKVRPNTNITLEILLL